MIETPLDVIRELAAIRGQSEKGLVVLSETEQRLAELDSEFTKKSAQAFLDAKGTVADREAVARLATADLKFQLELCRIEVNRVKAKLRQLSEAMMSVQTSARMVELDWKTSR